MGETQLLTRRESVHEDPVQVGTSPKKIGGNTFSTLPPATKREDKLTEFVSLRAERTSRPSDVSEHNIRVLGLVGDLLAEVLDARLGVSTASLSVEGLAVVGAEPAGERCPSVLDVVGDTLSVSSRVVAVEVLVDVEDQVGGGSVEIFDGGEGSGGTAGHECLSRSPVVAGEEDHLGSGTGLADGGNGGLDRGSPGGDVRDIMGLVHDSEDDFRLRGIFGSEVAPQ